MEKTPSPFPLIKKLVCGSVVFQTGEKTGYMVTDSRMVGRKETLPWFVARVTLQQDGWKTMVSYGVQFKTRKEAFAWIVKNKTK